MSKMSLQQANPVATQPHSDTEDHSVELSEAMEAMEATMESLEPIGALEPLEPLEPPRHALNCNALYVQYFAVGVVASALPATLYGFFMGYLEVSSYVYATAAQVIALPWSFKILYGMANDCLPIRGFRRKPYMAIGWTICSLALIGLACTDMPEVGDSDASGKFASLMALAAVGYIMADVAADGLTVEIAKREPASVRGTTQTNVYFARTLGSIVAALLVGFGMNGKKYNGTMNRSLAFTEICGILATFSVPMIPISWYYIQESRKPACCSVRRYLGDCYTMLQSKGMFYIALYCFAHGSIGDINTTASGNVAKYWAKVHNMQAALFGIVGAGIFALGLWIVKRYLLHVCWRRIIAGTTVLLVAIDSIFTYCTVYDVLRDQYFYLGETVVVMVPAAARFLMTTFAVVEISQPGKEGITYGLMTTLHNLGSPVAQATSNIIFGTFRPRLSDASNYLKDTPHFRNTVALSYAFSYAAGILALLLLPLFPSQKEETRHRQETWPRKAVYAKCIVAGTVVAWIYSVTLNMMAMYPQTQCLAIAGGDGC